MILRRGAVAEALAWLDDGHWHGEFGEPEWVEIPAGEFIMGSKDGDNDEKPIRKINLSAYGIAKTPITNAQYELFVTATKRKELPKHWQDGKPPKGRESHPVVNVNCHDAMAYGQWLSGVTGKKISLPTEAQWEKAARGGLKVPDRSHHKDTKVTEESLKSASLCPPCLRGETLIENLFPERRYPWGNDFDPFKCNAEDLGLNSTTPVGIFPDGASPYGVLDLSGNVWEWCLDNWHENYANLQPDGIFKDRGGKNLRVLRGGAFYGGDSHARCAYRSNNDPGYHYDDLGFRVCVSSI